MRAINKNNGLGRPRFIEKFDSMFQFFNEYLLPEKDKLIRMKQELKALQNKVNMQNQKVERAYSWLEHFKR